MHLTPCPGDPVALLSLSRVPPRSLLCTMVHGLASFPLTIRKDPISSTLMTQRRCSRSIRRPSNRVGSRDSFHSSSPASSFHILCPGLGSSLILASGSPLLCPHSNLSLLAICQDLENWFIPHPPSGVLSSSVAVCIRAPIFPLPYFPTTSLAPWRPGLSVAMSQRHP